MSVLVPVEDPSGVGEARRRSAALAQRASLGEQEVAALALVVTELATNLVKHTRSGGEILLRVVDGGRAVEVLAIDRGPGMAEIGRALRDRYSTAGSAGIGLGSIGRMAVEFDVHSEPATGTVILARVGRAEAAATILAGAVCLPKRGQEVAGDAWARSAQRERPRLIVADGVGHGPEAAAASAEALRVFADHPDAPLPELFRLLHARLHATRGAAVAVAELDVAAGEIRYAGVGNISGAIADPGAPGGVVQRNLVSHPGTVGHELHRVQEFRYPWPAGATLVMHSDGARARWTLDRYPGLMRRHPSVVAGVLYRDFARGTDDVTVAAARAAA